MLSFMREPEPKNASDHPSTGASGQDVPSADGSGPQEYLTVAANSKSLRRSTIVVIVLVGLGLACLFLMIRKSQPQAAAAKQGKNDQTKIEAAISRLTGVGSEMADRMDEIVQKFYEFSDVLQVKVNELAKNPFEVEGFAKDLKTEIVSDDPQEQAELVRRQRLQQRASTLRLLSIMRSDTGHCCMINDQILRQGDIVEGFTIAAIGSNYVDLVWSPGGTPGDSVLKTDDLKIVLKLSE